MLSTRNPTLVRLFVFFGSLLVLVLFAALIGPYFIDWSSYREDFEKRASHILGQKVQVLGSADARLVPFPSVSFDNVVVGEGKDGEPMMTIERFSMDAELAPFLSGEIRIFDMRIENPEATVRLSTEGELDWALRSEKALPAGGLVLENIGVVNGRITVLDEQNERQHVLDGINMHMSAKSIAGPWQIEGAGRLNGIESAFSLVAGPPTEEGGIRLRAKLLPVAQPIEIELEGDARVEALKPRYAGNFTVQALDTSKIQSAGAVKGNRGRRPLFARARGVFELDNERLRVEDYRLETGSPKDPYVISGEATLDTGRNPEFLLIADGQQLNFDRVSEGGNAETTARSFEQRLAAFRALLAWAPVPQMPGRVSAALPAVVAGDTTIRDILIDAHPDGNAWRIDRMAAKLPGRTQFEAEGRLGVGSEFGFSGEMVLASNQPSGFASWLTTDVDPSIRRLNAAGISAKVDLSAQLQRFDQMEIAIGSASLRGRLERVVPMQGRPSMNIVLDGEDVDLDAISAFAGLIVGGTGSNRLSGHDISARLSADRFEAFQVSAQGADLSLRLKGGTLDIDRFTVTDIAGASISSVGRLQNVFEAPEGDLDISVTADQAREVLTLLADRLPGNPVLDHLRENASQFNDTTIDLQSRFSNPQGSGAIMSTRARGETGGSKFNLTIERADALASLASGQFAMTADVRNNAPRQLLGQLGIEVLPIELDGPATLSAQIDGIPTEGMAFEVDYKAADSSVKTIGQVRQAGDGKLLSAFDVALVSKDLAPYLAPTGIQFAGPDSALPADLQAGVELSETSIALKGIEGTAGSTDVAGDLIVDREAEAFQTSGALTLSSVDLGWMAEMMLGVGSGYVADAPWNDQEFLPPLQSGTALDIDIESARVDLGPGLAAEQWNGKLVLQDNELQWRDIQADWLQGTLSGWLRLANRDGSAFLSGQLNAVGADVSPLVWQRDGFPVAKGRMNLAASFESAGKSLKAIISSLTGSGVLATEELEISGLESGSFPEILAVADVEGFEVRDADMVSLSERLVDQGSFYADEISVPFTIAAGTIRLPNVVLSDDGATVRGEARINLPERSVNGRFDLEFDPETEALTGAAPSIGMTFLGSLSEPDRTIDAGGLSNYLSLRAYERKRRQVETAQAIVLENQRLRREAALSRQRSVDRKAALERLQEEEAQRQAEEEARLEKEREEKAAAEAAARLALEEEARKREEEEQRQQLALEQERAAKKAAESVSRGKPLTDEQFIQQLEDAINRAGQRETGLGTAGASDTQQGVQSRPLPNLNFDTLDGGSVATQ